MSGKRLSGLINPYASHATMMVDPQRGVNNTRRSTHDVRLQLYRLGRGCNSVEDIVVPNKNTGLFYHSNIFLILGAISTDCHLPSGYMHRGLQIRLQDWL